MPYYICRDGLEDPVEDQGMVSQQLDQVSSYKRVIKNSLSM